MGHGDQVGGQFGRFLSRRQVDYIHGQRRRPRGYFCGGRSHDALGENPRCGRRQRFRRISQLLFAVGRPAAAVAREFRGTGRLLGLRPVIPEDKTAYLLCYREPELRAAGTLTGHQLQVVRWKDYQRAPLDSVQLEA